MEGAILDRSPRSSLIESELTEGPVSIQSLDDADSVRQHATVQAKKPEAEPGESLADGSRIREVALKREPIFWAVGGGKGGVGKSLISANFSLSLGRKGRKVVAVDLDLGGSNLHTCLGIDPPPAGLGDWAVGRAAELESLLVPCGEEGVRFLSGSSDPLKISSLMDVKREELLKQLKGLDVDDVVLDLGAGTQDLTVDFFSLANRGIISVLPEPTSVENAYRFIRAVIFRRFQHVELSPGIREVTDAASDPKNVLGIKTPGDLLAVVDRLDVGAGQKMREALRHIDLSVVINQVRTPVDVDVGRAICSVCRRYFGMDVKYAGYLDYDNSVWKSVRSRKAVIREYPHSVLANRIERLTRTLLGEERGLFP